MRMVRHSHRLSREVVESWKFSGLGWMWPLAVALGNLMQCEISMPMAGRLDLIDR